MCYQRLNWHLERRKKHLLKFHVNLARRWAELEEQRAAHLRARDGSERVSTRQAAVMGEGPAHFLRASLRISDSQLSGTKSCSYRMAFPFKMLNL